MLFDPDLMLIAKPGAGATDATLRTLMNDAGGSNFVQIFLNDELSMENVIARLVHSYGEESVKLKFANQTLMVYSIFQRFDADEIIAQIKERHAGKVVWVYIDMPSCTALDLKDGPRMRIVNNSDLIRFLEEDDFRLRTGTIRKRLRPC
jgi:hypothetical protein